MRAYPSSEALVDQGLIATVEWRWSYNGEFTPFVFYDAARGRPLKQPGPFDLDANSRSLRGMGIGLNICRSVIEYHRGEFELEPAPGGGCRFRFRLPVRLETAGVV